MSNIVHRIVGARHRPQRIKRSIVQFFVSLLSQFNQFPETVDFRSLLFTPVKREELTLLELTRKHEKSLLILPKESTMAQLVGVFW